MKKISVLLLSAFAAFAAILPAVATIGVTVNGTDISAGSGTSPAWTYNGTNLALTASGASYVISGNNNGTPVSIQPQTNCTVVASNLVIDDSNASASALYIGANPYAVTLLLSGTNTLAGGGTYAGIAIEKGSGSLSISNLEASAALVARGGSNDSEHLGIRGGAGIGGGSGCAGGTVTISGGAVTATGGNSGAGIGGSYQGAGGRVTISGGTVTAAGGVFGAGIGGGDCGAGGGTVTISGGTVTATGSNLGAGIGGGNGGAGGTVTVSGGLVTANGGVSAAGIGGGCNGADGTVKVSGGTVIATGSHAYGAEDIGYGRYATASGANTFTGGSIFLANHSILQMPKNGAGENVYPATFTNITSAAAFADLTNGLARLSPACGVNGIVPFDGKVCAWLPRGNYSFTIGGEPVDLVLGLVGVTVNGADISMSSGGSGANAWDFSGGTLAFRGVGPYVVSGANGINSVTLAPQVSGTTLDLSNLVVDVACVSAAALYIGTNSYAVTLLLSGTNTLASGDTFAGVTIEKGSGSLTISNLDASAALFARGGPNSGAGIGGGSGGTCGTVTISGGAVSATGSFYAAGIGGGNGGAGGTVTVSGGSVTAAGGVSAAGIGGGNGGAGGTVTVSGGSVTATGGNSGAGIGGGWQGKGGTVTISGGTVIATGDHTKGAEDIGHGFNKTASGANTFTGGSILLANNTSSLAPSNGTARVWCVTFTNMTTASALTDLTSGLAGYNYGVNGITAPGGNVYAWLPSGTYCFTLDGKLMKLVVDGSGHSGFQPAALVGVTVNGRDIVYASGGSAKEANTWSYNGADLILSGYYKSYVISGSNGTNLVALYTETATPSIVLSNLTIDVSAFSDRPALRYNRTTLWNYLYLYGKNTLKSGLRRAGIESTGGYFFISSLEPSATLVAQGGGDGAGIGGAQSNDCGSVWIYGGTITAAGQGGGAGIGGGAYGNGGNVKIFGGLVTASGGNGGAGIGGGWDGNGGTLAVSGGTVRAIRGDRGSVNTFYDIGGEIDHGTSTFTSGANTFTGGSVWLANGLIANAPSNGTERVFCVTNGGFVANAPVSLGLSGCGTSGLVADGSGKIYLWLPAGGYLEGGSSTDGTVTNAVLRGFGVSGTGAVTGPTNVTLAITGFAPEAGVTNWTPKALSQAHVETIYSTNLTDTVWSADRPTNAPSLFLKLRVR